MASATTTDRQVPWIVEFYRSALGKKYAMAISGIMMLGFVLAHMIGNLKVYLGAEELDGYAAFLKDDLLYPILPHGITLWALRLGLIVALVVHVHAAWALTRMNKRARGVGYQSKRDFVAADFAARTMRWTGVVVLAFIGFHLADLTFGYANPTDIKEAGVYAGLVASFQRTPVAIFYIIANIALGMHLYHGTWSLFQTLGLNNRRFNEYRRMIAIGLTAVIVIGNISFPIAVMTGVVA